MNSYTVYKHTTPSGKVYIGITKQPLSKRWKNGAGYERCTAFSRAIKKYGWGNISHEILADGLTETEACALEVKYISEYKSNDPAYGYNLTTGGEHYSMPDYLRRQTSVRIRRMYEEHPEIKDKISSAQTGRKASAETKQKMSKARKAYIAAHPETREQCRALFLGKSRGADFSEKIRQANYKKIVCIDTGRTFPSITAAAAFAGVGRTSISNVLTGRAKTAGGYHFTYATEANNDQ